MLILVNINGLAKIRKQCQRKKKTGMEGFCLTTDDQLSASSVYPIMLASTARVHCTPQGESEALPLHHSKFYLF